MNEKIVCGTLNRYHANLIIENKVLAEVFVDTGNSTEVIQVRTKDLHLAISLGVASMLEKQVRITFDDDTFVQKVEFIDSDGNDDPRFLIYLAVAIGKFKEKPVNFNPLGANADECTDAQVDDLSNK